MKKKNHETFSDRLYKFRRKELALNQKEFAKILDYHPLTISYYETDERNPNLVFFQKVKKKWKVNLNWLISGQGEMFVRDNKKYSTPCPTPFPTFFQTPSQYVFIF